MFKKIICFIPLYFLILMPGLLSGQDSNVKIGHIKFKSTNYPDFIASLVGVKGSAKEISGRVEVADDQIDSINVSVPVLSIDAGSKRKTSDMQKRVFTVEDGTMPDVKFVINGIEDKCRFNSSDTKICLVNGIFSFRNIENPLVAELAFSKMEDGNFSLSTKADVDLEKYNVKVNQVSNIIKLDIDLIVTP